MRKLFVKYCPNQLAILIIMSKYDCTYKQAKNIYNLFKQL